jgi:uncharacterized protein (TIGR02001 family)
MNLFVRVFASAAALLLAVPAVAHAEEADFSFSLTGATDYVWRGVSQSDNNPAVFATAQVNYGQFYLGAGAENVDFLGIDTEYDIWGGWSAPVGSVTLDVGFVRYGYVDAPSGADLDTIEAKVGVSTTFGQATVGAAVYFTDDYFATEDEATYVEVNGRYALNDKWSVSGAVAQQDFSGGDYTTWNVGVGYALAENVSLDVRYSDTDLDNNDLADGRIVVSFRVAI